jgi:mannose-1-phosphate guanylyltransferase
MKKAILTPKPWGQEEILETNDYYTVKRITMYRGHQCSLQRHTEKLETFVLLEGKMLLIDDNRQHRLHPGAVFTIKPGVIHRMAAITDIVYLECSTSQLDDVVRLSDVYGRA